jgi:hypothetical protein
MDTALRQTPCDNRRFVIMAGTDMAMANLEGIKSS